jgi:hypothetical protein
MTWGCWQGFGSVESSLRGCICRLYSTHVVCTGVFVFFRREARASLLSLSAAIRWSRSTMYIFTLKLQGRFPSQSVASADRVVCKTRVVCNPVKNKPDSGSGFQTHGPRWELTAVCRSGESEGRRMNPFPPTILSLMVPRLNGEIFDGLEASDSCFAML